ncbi:MAG: site-specific DNA-methyltransferase [Smithella sp.]|jgi:DNA modification methylase
MSSAQKPTTEAPKKAQQLNQIYQGDCLEVLKTFPDNCIDCCVTSPPYWGLRDYGVKGQYGLEQTPEEYVNKMVEVFREVRRVLKNEGTCWLNLGDSYCGGGSKGDTEGAKQKTSKGATWGDNDKVAKLKSKIEGIKTKDIVGIPWMVAFALRADGWYLRQDIIWNKPNPMPESVTDRCTKSHEYVFLLSKSQKYYYDNEAIMEPCIYPGDLGLLRSSIGNGNPYGEQAKSRVSAGVDSRTAGKETRNKRSVWKVTTKPFNDAHFATFPEDLIKPMILAGSPQGGIVLDPFGGSGTTLKVAESLNRRCTLIELNPEYIKIAEKRTWQEVNQMKMAV